MINAIDTVRLVRNEGFMSGKISLPERVPNIIEDSRDKREPEPQAPGLRVTANVTLGGAGKWNFSRYTEGLALVVLAAAAAPAFAAAETVEAWIGPIGLKGAILGTVTGAGAGTLAAARAVGKEAGLAKRCVGAFAGTVAGALAGGTAGIAGGWLLGTIFGGFAGGLTGMAIEEKLVEIAKEKKQDIAAVVGHFVGHAAGKVVGKSLPKIKARLAHEVVPPTREAEAKLRQEKFVAAQEELNSAGNQVKQLSFDLDQLARDPQSISVSYLYEETLGIYKELCRLHPEEAVKRSEPLNAMSRMLAIVEGYMQATCESTRRQLVEISSTMSGQLAKVKPELAAEIDGIPKTGTDLSGLVEWNGRLKVVYQKAGLSAELEMVQSGGKPVESLGYRLLDAVEKALANAHKEVEKYIRKAYEKATEVMDALRRQIEALRQKEARRSAEAAKG